MVRRFVALGLCLTPGLALATGNKSVSGAIVSKTMGGTGVAHFGDEFDAVLENPAMMTYSNTDVGTHKFALEVDATYVDMQNAPAPKGETYAQSKGKAFYLPFFGYFYNVNEKVKFGTGLYQIAGASSDFSDTTELAKGKNSFSFLAMPFSVSYALNDASSFGVSFNAISANLAMGNDVEVKSKTTYTFTPSFGYVHNFGDGHLLGAHYLRGVDANFTEMADIDGDGQLDAIKMGNPDEFRFGYGRNLGAYSYTGEYKYVTWGNAANFKDLGWENQNVFAVAGQRHFGQYTLRGGLTYATQTVPVEKDVNGDEVVDFQGKKVSKYFVQAQNSQNGITQSAVTVGAGYQATPALNFNTGLVYFFEKAAEQTGTSTFHGGEYKMGSKLQTTEFVFMASYALNPDLT